MLLTAVPKAPMSNPFDLKYSGGGGGGAGAITCFDDDIGSPAKVTIARETISHRLRLSVFSYSFLYTA
jgi:hypothetical protein